MLKKIMIMMMIVLCASFSVNAGYENDSAQEIPLVTDGLLEKTQTETISTSGVIPITVPDISHFSPIDIQ